MIERSHTEVVAGDEEGQEHRLPSSIGQRVEAIDRHVAARMRERRIVLGLSQQQLAELVGITVQQACKYETGSNRVAAGRLYRIAQALGIDVGYFFEGMGKDNAYRSAQQRLLMRLARDFMAIRNRRHQEELISLARALSEPEAGPIAVRDTRRRIVWPG
jgi:transcriptional regulator with XRE-family HTH domain